MTALRRITILLFIAALSTSCQGKEDGWDTRFVIADAVPVYERPSPDAKAAGGLKFGSKIKCSDRGLKNVVTRGWLHVKSGDVRGYIRNSGIADEALYREIDDLFKAAKEAPVQASGETTRKAALLLKPENGAFVLQRMRNHVRVEILERIVVTSGKKGKEKKRLYYKVRLADGRAGFLRSRQLRLTPPAELNVYTQVRTPVSWYVLGEKEDPETKARCSEYLVTYESAASDIETDFNRMELYTCDPKTRRYGTALAKSGLHGILPVEITDASDGGRTIRLRQHPGGNAGKIQTIRYSYPNPIKLLDEKTEEAPAENH